MMKLILLYQLNFPLLLNLLILMMIMFPQKSFKLHPINLMFLMIFYTILISININYNIKSWMNFIIILVLIGGLMIIFLYITSLTNNEFFLWNFKNIFNKIIIIMIFNLLMIFFFNNNSKIYMLINNNYENMNNWLMNELFNFMMYPMLFFMSYLYFSLISIMNICYKLNLPLRQIFFYE